MWDEDLAVDVLTRLKQGQAVQLHAYNYNTHAFNTDTVTVEPRPIVLLSGTMLLWFPKLRQVADLKIFVDLDPDTRLSRRGTNMHAFLFRV